MPNPTFQRGKKIRHREKMKAAAFSINKEMMFYFLQAAQIDDKVTITPSIIAETRRRAHLDLMVTHGNHTV